MRSEFTTPLSEMRRQGTYKYPNTVVKQSETKTVPSRVLRYLIGNLIADDSFFCNQALLLRKEPAIQPSFNPSAAR